MRYQKSCLCHLLGPLWQLSLTYVGLNLPSVAAWIPLIQLTISETVLCATLETRHRKCCHFLFPSFLIITLQTSVGLQLHFAKFLDKTFRLPWKVTLSTGYWNNLKCPLKWFCHLCRHQTAKTLQANFHLKKVIIFLMMPPGTLWIECCRPHENLSFSS